MRIGKLGIWHIHAKKHPIHNDEVCWLWPWKRSNKKKKWLSIGFNSTFESLKEIDETWDGYCVACKECFKESIMGG